VREELTKIDKTVRRESIYILVWVLILSLCMQAVILIIRKWDYSCLLGNLLSAAAASANFFVMGLTVQKAVDREEKQAANLMKLSQTLRNMALLLVAVIGVVLPVFNMWTVIIPLFFPRIAIMIRPFFDKKTSLAAKNEEAVSEVEK
jgi:hypothetical protein